MLLGLGKGKRDWRVRYESGELSERLNKKTAKDYLELFGGEMIYDPQEDTPWERFKKFLRRK